MKRIKYILTIVFITVISLGLNKTVNAEEETSSSATTESGLQAWVNENLGWIIGIPTGTVSAILIEILVLADKSKKKLKEINETQDLNAKGKLAIDTTKELLTDTKKLTKNLTDTVNVALDQINKTDLKVNELVTNLSNNLTSTLNVLSTNVTLLEKRLAALEDVQEMIALHSKELVANGTAEKIAKKLRG